MRITLVHPPVYLNIGAQTAHRPCAPIGLAYIAAALEHAGHEVAVVDAVTEAPEQVVPEGRVHRLGLSPAQIAESIDPESRMVGITNMWTFSWPLVREIIAQIRRRLPHALIVGGGEHFSGLPELSLRQAPLDLVAIGEGEDTAVDIAARFETGGRDAAREVAGVAYLEQGKFCRTRRRERIRALDQLPWPAWHLFDLEAYNWHRLTNGVRTGFTVPILATRGCPYQCTYCSSPGMWGTQWVARDPKLVVDEIEQHHRRHGATNFPLHDLTAILKRSWIVEFAQEILARRLDIVWQFPSGTRCEVIDDEVATLMARSGGRHVAFAPESGSARTRDLVQKRMTEDALLAAATASVKAGLNVTFFLVLGFPHDTRADLRESVRIAHRLAKVGVDDVALAHYYPIPATELFQDLLARGRVVLSDEFLMTPIFTNDSRWQEQHNYCEALSARELTRFRYRILTTFYGTSLLHHPAKFARLLFDVLRGRETRKMAVFFIELGRKAKIGLRAWFRSRARTQEVRARLPHEPVSAPAGNVAKVPQATTSMLA